MSLRQAAQQALEALTLSIPKPRPADDDYAELGWKEHNAAITALRAALAEPECKCTMRQKMVGDGCAVCNPERAKDLAEPEQEMTKQKPVAWTDGRGFIASHADSFPRGTTVSPLYAHPPTPRNPLKDEAIESLRWCISQMPEPVLPGDYTDGYKKARAALAKVEASK